MKTTHPLLKFLPALWLLALPAAVHAQDYTYTISEGTVTVNTYTGAGGDVTIPATIEGLPVIAIGNWAFEHSTNLTSVTISDSVTSIGEGAFGNCSSLTSVMIPDSVTSIADGAFSGCTSLTGISIPDRVIRIGWRTFSDCSSLTDVTIPDSVTIIGEYAFSHCTSLTSITIPAKVTRIGARTPAGDAPCPGDAFMGSSSLEAITVDPDNTVYGSVDGVLFSKNRYRLEAYPGGRTGAYTIPERVTTIGESAFSSCKNLTAITFPASVTTIGEFAFQGCTGLTQVTIPNNVTSIGREAFQDCTSLATFTIPASITAIENSTFAYCTSLAKITIPSGVTSIGYWAFSGCTSLASITIPNSVTSIEHSAFSGCSSLTSITIPDSVTSIGDWVFGNCANLVEITIPDSITTIREYTFYSCTSLINVRIPDSVTSIEYRAFNGCSSLTSVTISASITSIGSQVFSGCSSLTAITVDGANPAYSSRDGVLFKKNQATLLRFPCGNAGVYTVPDSVIIIEEAAFQSCGNLTSVIIPDSVRIIGDLAFASCANLTRVIIPDSVASLGSSTFVDCVNLASISIPDSVAEIGNWAFSGCSSLTNVTIPSGVTIIDSKVFAGCSSLVAITVDADNPNYSSVDGVLFDKSQTSLFTYPGGRTGAYTIPASVTFINSYGFAGCTSLTRVTIHDSVTSIGSRAFSDCASLTTVYFEGDAPHLSWEGVFDGTDHAIVYYLPGTTGWEATYDGRPTSMVSPAEDFDHSIADGAITITNYFGTGGEVTIPPVIEGKPVTRIWGNAFRDNASLTHITIPATVIDIQMDGDAPVNVFAGCSRLVEITVNAGNSAFSSMDGVLFNKSQTRLLRYPVGKAGAYVIPGDVTGISEHAFAGCTGLTSVTIPASVTFIATWAFEDCTSLTTVYFEGDAPETDAAPVFQGSDNVIVYTLPGTTGWGETWAGVPTQALGRVSNLSTRGQILTGDDILIGGLVIAGDEPRTMLLRGIGPALDAFLEPGTALSDPVMTVFSGKTEILSNDDWSTQPDADAVAQLAESLGAFPLLSGSKDAAVQAMLDPGTYTVHLSGKNGTGIGLIELYNGSNGGNSRLVNISTRGRVGAGASIMVPGIVVTENIRRLLIRGIGPELARSLGFNRGDVLPDPILTLKDHDGLTVATNDDWSTGMDAAEIAAVARHVGAFPLTDGSADAVILIEVPAGVYTALVSDASGAEGIALVEVYTAP